MRLTDFFCPSCKSDSITFELIPPSELSYKRGHEEHVEYMPPIRDCTCDNCETSFLLPLDDSDIGETS